MNPKEKRKKIPIRPPKPREHEDESPVVVENNDMERNEVEDVNREERERVPGDDCEAIVDDSDDELVEQAEENDVEEEETCGIRVEEEACEVLPTHFGDVARNDGGDDDESGDDDCWKEDNIPDPISSDDEEEDARREAREDEALSDEVLALGKTFSSAAEFKQALLRYSMKTRYDVKLYISSQLKLGAVCSDTEYDCPWRVYCSYEKRKHKLQIKVYVNEHTCIRSGYSKLLKTSSIVQLFAERLRLNPKLTAIEISEEIKRTYSLIVTDEQCRKAKTKITRERRAGHEAHFSRIWDYEAELHKKNPGTITEIVTIPGATPRSKQRFDRFYVCFEAQRSAWPSTCRPIIGLDGAFLKWDVKGQLIAAVGRDGDNRIVPIAWAVVEIENDINWAWFVNHLKMDLELGDGSNFTIISDRQKVTSVLLILRKVYIKITSVLCVVM